LDKYYYELTIKPDAYYELFLDLASSLTDDALEECDNSIIIRSVEELDNLKDGIEAFATELSTAFNTKISCELKLEKKENQDWILKYQQSVQPIEVGNFYIHPSWNKPANDKINITIDPTLAFGSGHHETTNTCLQAIEKYVTKGQTVCDVGTGSGILGIAAAKLKAIVDICDTDDVAVDDAIKNFKTNDTIPNKTWIGSANNTKEKYDITIANIVADVLTMIHKDLKKITKQNGIIILSGIMEQHKDKVLKKFSDCKTLEIIQQNEWVTIIVKRVENEQ